MFVTSSCRREATEAQIADLVGGMLAWEKEQPRREEVSKALGLAVMHMAGTDERERSLAEETKVAHTAAGLSVWAASDLRLFVIQVLLNALLIPSCVSSIARAVSHIEAHTAAAGSRAR